MTCDVKNEENTHNMNILNHIKAFMILLCLILISGCMKDTNDHLGNMDTNTKLVAQDTKRLEEDFAAMNKRMELLTKELELTNRQVSLMTNHVGTLTTHAADISSQLRAFQEYAAIISLEMSSVSKSLDNMSTSLKNVSDLAQLAKTMMSSMFEQAFTIDTPPPPTDDLEDLLNPRPTPTPTPGVAKKN